MCLAAPAVQAVGFGRLVSSTVLGGPLDVVAPITLAPGESVQADCVSAEVMSGDDLLTSQVIRASITRGEDGPRVRVQTTVRIDEPVVTVQLGIECGAGISRRFTVLVDPPDYTPPPSLATVSPDTADTGVVPATDRPGDARTAGKRSPRDATRARSPSAPRTAERPAVPGATRAARVPSAVASAAVSSVARRPSALASAPAVARAPTRASSSSGPRLVLDADPGRAAPVARTAPIPGTAASPTEADADAAALAALRAQEAQIKVLEATLERLRAAEAAQAAQLARVAASATTPAIPAPVRAAEVSTATTITVILWALAAAVLTLLIALGLLMWKRVRLQRRTAWWPAKASPSMAPSADAEPAGEPVIAPDPLPSLPDERVAAVALPFYIDAPAPVSVAFPATPPPMAAPRPAPQPPAPSAAAPPSWDAPPLQLPGISLETDSAPPPPPSMPAEPVTRADIQPSARDLTVEDLLDIEQQADFFVVLGQDDAAVDLLMSMVRSSGGSSPLPYIKLLDIYRRGDDRGPYDRIRERFNQRFNGAAPAWEDDLALGRDLEQYPGVLTSLEDAWLSPSNACQALEQMLFRRNDPETPQFDLPAFAELLFLHRLALDMVEQQRANDGVDLLIPF